MSKYCDWRILEVQKVSSQLKRLDESMCHWHSILSRADVANVAAECFKAACYSRSRCHSVDT